MFNGWQLPGGSMKIEYKLIIRKPNEKMEILEYNESRTDLEHKAELLSKENPDWEVRVVRENYNVS